MLKALHYSLSKRMCAGEQNAFVLQLESGIEEAGRFHMLAAADHTCGGFHQLKGLMQGLLQGSRHLLHIMIHIRCTVHRRAPKRWRG